MIQENILEDDLDVAVVVDIGQGDARTRTGVWRRGDRGTLPT